MQRLERIRYVAANYYLLQGLRFAPLGLVFVLWSAIKAGWIQVQPDMEGLVSGWGFSLALVLYPLIQVYYDRTFGRAGIECKPKGVAWGYALATLVMLPATLVGAILLEILFNLPVRLFGLVVAGALLFYFWPRRRFAMHYVVLGAAILVVSLAASIGGLGWTVAGSRTGLGALYFMFMGLVLLAGGLFDHVLLVRTFKPVPAEDGKNNAAI